MFFRIALLLTLTVCLLIVYRMRGTLRAKHHSLSPIVALFVALLATLAASHDAIAAEPAIWRMTAVLLLDEPETKTGAFWFNARNDSDATTGFQTGVGNWDPRARVTGHANLPISAKGWTVSTGLQTGTIDRNDQVRFTQHVWIIDRPVFHQDQGKNKERLVHLALSANDVKAGGAIAVHWNIRESKDLAPLKNPTFAVAIQQGIADAGPWTPLPVSSEKNGAGSFDVPATMKPGVAWIRIGIAEEGGDKADRLWAQLPLTVAVDSAPIPAPLKTETVRIGAADIKTRVPSAVQQGVFLHPQSVSAIDISSDEKSIGASTMAFRHDHSFWMLDAKGEFRSSRFVEPWAPFQTAVQPGGKVSAVGLAYSRFTDPSPTVAIDHDGKETALVDAFWDMGWLRYGEGDWRTGWTPSLIGDLLVRGRDRVFTVAGHNGALEVDASGNQQRYPLNYQRPYRMTASRDGHVLAMGYLAPEAASLDQKTKGRLRLPPAMLRVIDAQSSAVLWEAKGLADAAAPPKPPEPADEFGEFADDFNMKPQEMVSFRSTLSVALAGDGSRTAVAEFGGWLRIKRERGIGKWNPDHQMFLCPRQRGWLRVFGPRGQELAKVPLPKAGLFDLSWSRDGESLWCVPASWFARGLAGRPWLPTEPDGNSVYRWDLAQKTWTEMKFPDAVSDFALHPDGDRALISCWDGKIYLVARDGKVRASQAVDEPARVQWSSSGRFAVYGTQNGQIGSLDAEGKPRWKRSLPIKEAPAVKEPPKQIFDDFPIYAVGRVGTEHAYVGDIWLIKTKEGGILVDSGGTSGLPQTWQRLKSLGIEPKEIRYVLLSHSHGDHVGGAYLWRTMGAKIVAPATAAFAVTWAMPTWSDYSIWPPSPIDQPLPLKRAGDTVDFKLCGVPFKAVFVPGHSFDSVIYLPEFNGKRVAFTGDMGFDGESHILHRCWTDREKAAKVVSVVKEKVLPLEPVHVFTGHGTRAAGKVFLEDLVRRTSEALAK